MSTITTSDSPYVASDPDFDAVALYRGISKAAIFSVGLGLLSVPGLLFPGVLVLALVGFVLGLIAMRSIRRYPDELTGRPVALIGVVLCGCMFVGGVAAHVIDYVTELPEGYASENRVSFAELQPDKAHPELPIAPLALELHGRKIFLKGYVHPEYNHGEVRKFVLVPDMGTCCFGGQPKLTDMIEVTLRDPHRIRYNQRLRKVAGVFLVDPAPVPIKGLGGVVYQIDAEYAK